MSLSTTPQKPHRRGLSSWIALSGILAVCLVTVVLLVLVERFARDNAARNAKHALDQIAWQMRDQLDRGMSYRYEELSILAGLDDLGGSQDSSHIRELLERVQTSFPQYAWMGFCNTKGVVEAATGGLLEGKDVSSKDWFQNVMKHGTYVGDVHKAVLLAKLLPKQDEPWRFVDIAVPVLDDKGVLTHILAAHLSWEWTRELRASLIAPAADAYQAEVFVVSAAGEVLLGPKGAEGKPIGLPGFAQLAKTRTANAMQTWNDGMAYATSAWATQGHQRYPGLGWIIVVRQPEAVAFAEYTRLRHEIILGGLAVCLLAGLCAPLVARRLTRPLQELTSALDARTDNAEAPIPVLSNSYHEANALSKALADFAEREHGHVDELRRVNEALEQRVQERTAEIQDRELEIRAILEQVNEAFVRMDCDGHILEWNKYAEQTFGWERWEILGKRFGELVIPANQREEHARSMRRHLNAGYATMANQRMELIAQHKDGRKLEVEMIISATHHKDGKTFNAFLHDIGERKRAEIALRESREHLSAITNNIPALIADVGPDLRYRFANKAYEDWFGIKPESLIGKSMRDLYGEEHIQEWQTHLDAVLRGERVEFERTRVIHGEYRYETAIYLPEFDQHGQSNGFHALIFDITARKALEMRLKNEATHDALTGLPNRRNLIDRLPQSIARCDRQKRCLALLFLDLNGFKAVNDTYGHDAGDALLKQASARMQAVLRKSDTVFRLAGDEFVVLLDTLNGGEEDARMVAHKIDQVIETPFDLDGTIVKISVSTGVSIYWPGDKHDADTLLATADAAMYEAKKARKAAASGA